MNTGLEKRFPRAYMAFSSEHWRQLYSTNPLGPLVEGAPWLELAEYTHYKAVASETLQKFT